MDPTADPFTLPLAPPRLTSAPTLVGIASGSIGFLLGYLSMPGKVHWQVAAIGALASAAFLAVVIAIQILLIRRRGAESTITIADGTVILPASSRSWRAARVPVEQIRSAVLLGHAFYARLTIDAGNRLHVFPAARLPTPRAVPELQAALRTALLARPNGDALWAAMQARHQLAENLGKIRPMGTWVMVGTIVACFCLQLWALRPNDPFGLVDLGANASVLVWHGQWFRLITANLLHANPRHVFGNALSLLVFGTLVERLIGFRHCLIVLLTACVASQIVSAAAGAVTASHVFSVGISGGIFGLIGALAAIGWRFGAGLPAGYRLPPRVWLGLAALYGIVFPLLVPQIDSWAHAGGALTGLAAGAWLCRVPDIGALRRTFWLTGDALAAAGLVFAVAIGADLYHASGATARYPDRLLLAQGMARSKTIAPAVRNAFAWQVATDADAPPLLLRWAEYLAGQARTEFRASRPKGWGWVNAADTQAVLAARLGDTIRAARIEAELPWQTQPFGSHLAMFLDTLTHQGTPQILGDTGPDAPSITLAGGVLHLTQAAPAPQGARLYAVLRGRGGLAGVLFFRLPPGFSGTQILPLPSSEGPPGTAAPPPIWTDSATTIEIALFDRRGCFCSWPAMGPNFAAYTPDPELAP